MTAGLPNGERQRCDMAIRKALSSEDAESLARLTGELCETLPARADKIRRNSAYLRNHITAVSVCERDPAANNGGCTEPHVSHILAARLSGPPRTLAFVG
jgi:hypothetical protein